MDIVFGLFVMLVYNYGGEIYEVFWFVDVDVLGSWVEFYLEWCYNKGNGNYIVKDLVVFGIYFCDIGVFLCCIEEDVGC